MFDRLSEGRWWDRAWSLVEGCTLCSPGCDHCWLQSMARRFRPDPMEGAMGPRPVRFREDRLPLPLRARKPTAWAVWSDLFHPEVTAEDLAQVLDTMAAWRCGCGRRSCEHEDERLVDPGHVFLVLTKRADRIKQAIEDAVNWAGEHMPGDCAISTHYGVTDKPLPNLWLGVTVCNQEEAAEKIPLLLQVPAAVRFVSYEPALGPLRLTTVCGLDFRRNPDHSLSGGSIDWVIAGGESGPGARPAHPDWFRSVRDQCRAAGVPFLFKQWGEWIPSDQDPDYLTGRGLVSARPAGTGDPCCPGLWRKVGAKRAGRLLDGVEHNAVPSICGEPA